MKPMNELLADIVVASGGTVTSNTRNGLLGDWLDAVNSPSLSPTITLNPASQSVDEYGNVTFTGAASGDEPITYQWYKNGSPVGTNSTSYTLTATASDNGATVYFTATNSTDEATSSTATLTVISYIYQLDGVTQRALASGRLINPDGDIDIEFKTGPNAVSGGVDRVVISQCLTSTFAGSSGKEFTLYFNSSGALQCLHGGNFFNSSPNTTLLPSKTYRWRLQGNTQTFWLDGVQTDSSTITIGTAREPSAQCVIGAQTNGSTSTFRAFFSGGIYGLKVSSASTNEIPLNNKSQGANQLATVGSINATIINYNATGWTEI